jgi:hypothetical protein
MINHHKLDSGCFYREFLRKTTSHELRVVTVEGAICSQPLSAAVAGRCA